MESNEKKKRGLLVLYAYINLNMRVGELSGYWSCAASPEDSSNVIVINKAHNCIPTLF